MRLRFLIIFLLMFISVSCAQTNKEAELVRQIKDYTEGLIKNDQFSGALLVAKNDNVLLTMAGGEASKRYHVPSKVDTKFDLGSISSISQKPGQFLNENISLKQTNQVSLKNATAGLTEKLESENFIFHFKPGDGKRVEVERSEAFHKWAVKYLGVIPPKKIDFYMFPSVEEMNKIFGFRFGGYAYPDKFALVTAFPWHNHECFHLYVSLIGNPPRLFSEGIVIAHEFDPYNNVWISQWNRRKPYPEPHIKIVKKLKTRGVLYPMDSILESYDFDSKVSSETFKIGYEQAGAWVSYLVEKYGLGKMKKLIADISYYESKKEIKNKFAEIYGLSIADAETDWLAWLDTK